MRPDAQQRAGHRIRDLRIAAGLTQRQLASATGLSLTAVRDLEQGLTNSPRNATLSRLAETLGTTPAELSGQGRPLATVARPTEHGVQHPDGRPLRLRVLGPLAAWRGDVLLALGPHRDRAVLAMLALHPGQLVHRDALIGVIWQFLPPPATAVAMIQNTVSRLRRILAPSRAPAVLVTVGSRYQFVADHADLDLTSYVRLARAATTARIAGHLITAWTLYDQALALWTDDPAADIDLLRHTPVLTGLRAQHAALIADYAEHASSHGHHLRVLPHLLTLAEGDPYDERAHACLMIAQAGLGNKAEALATYDRIRAQLRDDGLIPGPLLRAAQTRILRGEVVCQPKPL